MSKTLKITEIAAQTGLSISTVSRVLAGKGNTSESARQRVLTCAKAKGVLQGIAAGRLLVNSLVVFAPRRAFDERLDVFYYRVMQGIGKALVPHDARLRFCALEENDSDTGLFLSKMNEPETEAAILLGIDDPHIHDLAADLGKPCVLINCQDRKMRLSGVAPDHLMTGRFAANYLFDMGHKGVLTVMCLRRYTMEQRLAGIRDAWDSRNLSFDETRHLLVAQSFGAKESEALISDYLAVTPRPAWPSALLVGGDFMAAGAVSALQKAGLRVPQDMSVMSIDGFNLAEIHDVPLTSVHVPRDELGEEAVQLLQQRLMRPEAPVVNILLGGTLKVQASVRRVGAGKGRPAVTSDKLYD
ncbi:MULTISPECIES: LacI family DNA-binding transcriptional regulator [unclassified Cedecea]|uniref:LacI family DNA-binding transcriptional regulator n=1 Tax=unclassified Cedecea TaxID=2649846 RepID=UPI00301A4E7E